MPYIDSKSKGKRMLVRLPTALLVAGIFMMSGCASGGYGRLYLDTEVTLWFRQNSVPDYYRYYTNGRSDMPYAIIGIDPRYRINTNIWEPVAPNTPNFADKIAFVWRPDIWEQLDPAQGAWIESPGGEKIGIWFSMYPFTTIELQEDNRVVILSPHNPGRE